MPQPEDPHLLNFIKHSLPFGPWECGEHNQDEESLSSLQYVYQFR